MRFQNLAFGLSALAIIISGFTIRAEAATYGPCVNLSYKPQMLLVLKRAGGKICWSELSRTNGWRLGQSRSSAYKLDPRVDIRSAKGYRFAYVTEAVNEDRYDRVISIKERHGPLDPDATVDIEFTEKVLLKRKGEDTRSIRGLPVTGIRTLCGNKFYRNLRDVIRNKRGLPAVGLRDYNSYHTSPLAIATGDLSFFHIQFRNRRGTCLFTDEVDGLTVTDLRESFAFKELGTSGEINDNFFVSLIRPIAGIVRPAFANKQYTTLVAHISKSYERNGFLISEFHTDVAPGTEATLTIRHLFSEGSVLSRFNTTHWRLLREK